MDLVLMDTEAAANFLGLKRRTLEKMRCTGGGPLYRKLGAAVRYARHDLVQYADERVRTSTSDPGVRR